jgi:GT2 family glycosyltransferase
MLLFEVPTLVVQSVFGESPSGAAERPADRMDLSIVLVYYKAPDDLPRCLASLDAETAGADGEIVIVDNDSRDGVPGRLAAGRARTRVITNAGNLGYARAVNQGIAATTGRRVLVMNPDCEVRPGGLAALAAHLDAHPRTGIVGPRLEHADGSMEYSARAFPDAYTFLFNRYSILNRLFPNNPYSRRYLMSDWDHACERDVDWLSGACLLVRREAIEDAGGMDEAFFMFNEDVDWCRRMKARGWAVTYVPGAVVVHHVGASRGRVSSKVIVERHRGMIHYFHKHHPTNPVLRLVADTAIMMRAGLMLAGNALKPRS